MTRRIDTYRARKAALTRLKRQLAVFLERTGASMDEVFRAVAWNEEIYRYEEWVKWFERIIARKTISDDYDGSIMDATAWQKDDWPHAIRARARAVGALVLNPSSKPSETRDGLALVVS